MRPSTRKVANSSNHRQRLAHTTAAKPVRTPGSTDPEAAELPRNEPRPESTPTGTLGETEVDTVVDAREPDGEPGRPPDATNGQPLGRFGAFLLSDDADSLDEDLLLTACPARQPRDSDLFRVRPDDGAGIWQMKTLVVDYRGEDPAVPRGYYLIHPRLARLFGGLARPYLLRTCVTAYGSMFLWPIRLVEGFGDSWCKSKLRIAAMAETQWVRILGSHGTGYTASVSRKDHGAPKWQGASFDELVGIAYDGRIVEELTHPLSQAYELG